MHAARDTAPYTLPPNLQLLCFPLLLLFLQERPLLLLPTGLPLGSICIMSPKSAACYDGITLHDGWIWVKAAIRTGYLANVLSRPCLKHKRGGETEYVKGNE